MSLLSNSKLFPIEETGSDIQLNPFVHVGAISAGAWPCRRNLRLVVWVNCIECFVMGIFSGCDYISIYRRVNLYLYVINLIANRRNVTSPDPDLSELFRGSLRPAPVCRRTCRARVKNPADLEIQSQLFSDSFEGVFRIGTHADHPVGIQ